MSSDRSTTAGIVGRNLQLVDGLVEARVGVDVRAEAHADRLHERDDVLLREVARAVERHVLDEVREPALIVVFEDRAGVDDEPELGAALRLLVRADVVAQAVRQRADGDPRVDGNGRRQRRVLRAGGDGALSGAPTPVVAAIASASRTTSAGAKGHGDIISQSASPIARADDDFEPQKSAGRTDDPPFHDSRPGPDLRSSSCAGRLHRLGGTSHNGPAPDRNAGRSCRLAPT